MLSKTLSKIIVYFTRRGGHRHPVIYPCIIILCALMLTLQPTVTALAASDGLPPFILLSDYCASIPIDGQFTLIAVCSNGTFPRFSSS